MVNCSCVSYTSRELVSCESSLPFSRETGCKRARLFGTVWVDKKMASVDTFAML